jgi:hypothetical protein
MNRPGADPGEEQSDTGGRLVASVAFENKIYTSEG